MRARDDGPSFSVAAPSPDAEARGNEADTEGHGTGVETPKGLRDQLQEFAARFGRRPTHVASVPGRVNLIGEHIDYCGLPVLPIAIDRHVKLTFRMREDGLSRIGNTSASYPEVEFVLRGGPVGSPEGSPRGPLLTRPSPGALNGLWARYCIAPAKELAGAWSRDLTRGIDGLVSSDLPVAAGLSSSSALVNAVGLALAWANGWRVCGRVRGRHPHADTTTVHHETPPDRVFADRLRMAGIMADAERHVGTRGGGMDQAVTLCARGGHALRIDFDPLRAEHLPFPESWRVVVAHSGVTATKGARVQDAYNRRRTESEAALGGVPWAQWRECASVVDDLTFGKLLSSIGAKRSLRYAERTLKGDYLRRFRHVVTEASRVDQASVLLRTQGLDGPSERARLSAFGHLMNASHASLRSDYEVSTPELDTLVGRMRSAGCVGARLTGAGFGGCAIGLVASGSEDAVIDALDEHYYGRSGIEPEVFVARPAAGAEVSEIEP